MLRAVFIAGVVLLPTMSSVAAAQRRASAAKSAAQGEEITVTIAAKVGGKSYQASGPGMCQHAADASIRGAAASLWTVQFAGSGKDGLKQLNLTLWRLKDGDSDQLSLSLDAGSKSHRIITGSEGENAGEGTVTILPSGPGGRLEISGKEASGKAVQVTIECSAFADVVAEGG